MENRRNTVLSVFAGLGGLDLGLERAGFELVGCVEADEMARRSIKANRDSWTLLEPHTVEDVADSIQPSHLGIGPGELTLLAGAPPCQPYSKAGLWAASGWGGFADSRAHPLLAFLELARKFRPEAILMENVPGFVFGPNSVADLIEEILASINDEVDTDYRLSTAILNAADFGVPQHRRRAILVALRDGSEMEWPSATHRNRPVRAWDALYGLPDGNDLPQALGKWADLLPSIPEGRNYLWHTARGGGEPLFGYRTRYWSFLLKLAKDQPSWTLPASPGPSVGPFHWDSRPLTATEALRIQSFPASWRVEGHRREQIRQIGNATPPLLGEVLGRSLLTHLRDAVWRKSPSLMIPRKRIIPRSSSPAPVPDSYLHLVGNHEPHPGTGKGPSPRV